MSALDVKVLGIQDVVDIPSELIQKNYVAGSKLHWTTEDQYRQRLLRFVDDKNSELYGAFAGDELVAVLGSYFPQDFPAYYISNARIFKSVPGFPVLKNGWGTLSDFAIARGEMRNRWEVFIRRSTEIERWGNRRYVNSFFTQTRLGSIYQRAIVDFIPASGYSRWKMHNQVTMYESTPIDTILIKCWCPYEHRSNKNLPAIARISDEIHTAFLNQRV